MEAQMLNHTTATIRPDTIRPKTLRTVTIRSIEDLQLADDLQHSLDAVAISYAHGEMPYTNAQAGPVLAPVIAPVIAAAVSENGSSYIVESDTDEFLQGLGNRRRIYHDALAARSLESRQMLPLANKYEDIGAMARLLDENLPAELHDLQQRFLSHCHHKLQIFPSKTLAEASLIQNIWSSGRLKEEIKRQGLKHVYRKIELPVIDATILMMNNGISIDMPALQQLHNEYEAQIKSIKQRMGESAKKLDTKPASKPAGANNNRLQRIQNLFRYTSSLLRHVDQHTGRIHCRLDPLGTKTGRFSCREPNLQGLPGELKHLLVAEDGYSLIEADYSQLELRILAYYSREPKLLAAYKDETTDVHRRTAAIIFGKSTASISKAEREIAKRVNFGIIYGLTPMGLAEQLGIDNSRAETLIKRFMHGYPYVRQWIEKVEKTAVNAGFVQTLYGRIRRFPGISQYSTRALRQAVNAVIQGTAADIMKMAIIRLHKRLPSDCRMLLTVHDSVLVEAPVGQIKQVKQLICETMEEQPPEFDVDLKVNLLSAPDTDSR